MKRDKGKTESTKHGTSSGSKRNSAVTLNPERGKNLKMKIMPLMYEYDMHIYESCPLFPFEILTLGLCLACKV